jgi:hypothetical protein
MRPENIIQTKDWHELTFMEKELLFELASNEAEFNLLKNILFVAIEEMDETPLLNSSIKRELNIVLANTKKSGVRNFWYWAAAAVIAILFAGWFIMQHNEKKQELVIVPYKKENYLENSKKDSNGQQINPDKLVIEHRSEIKVDNMKRVIRKKILTGNINTSISRDTTLLAFVTEVY